MSKPKILIQLDSDQLASSFDAVVAVDSGVEHLLQYAGVTPDNVESLIHGAIFTRGPQDLHQTAVFIGGSNVTQGEALLKRVNSIFFGPMRVSVLLDSNGANTTAAAAVLAAAKHVSLNGAKAVVLAGTGPVGQRAARLLARRGADVLLASRRKERADEAAEAVRELVGGEAAIRGAQTATDDELQAAVNGREIVIAAGTTGVQLFPKALRLVTKPQVVIDLNAVPPLGIEGTEVMDKATERDGTLCYGAIGVGGTKMKIHKEAVRRLFAKNDLVLDAEEIFAIGEELDA